MSRRSRHSSSFRLQGGYFAIGTWVIAEVIRLIVVQNKQLGAGTGTTIQALVSMNAADRGALTFWLALVVGFGSVALVALIMRSRVGLALERAARQRRRRSKPGR